MAIGVSSKERKPVATVTVGSVAISIYAAPVTVRAAMPAAADSSCAASATESKVYQSFQVAHYEGNRRILQRRNTLDKAKALAKEIANRLSRDGARAQYLTEKDRRVLILAQTTTAPLGLEARFAADMPSFRRGLRPARWTRRSASILPTASASATVRPSKAFTANTWNTSSSAASAITTCAT